MLDPSWTLERLDPLTGPVDPLPPDYTWESWTLRTRLDPLDPLDPPGANLVSLVSLVSRSRGGGVATRGVGVGCQRWRGDR